MMTKDKKPSSWTNLPWLHIVLAVVCVYMIVHLFSACEPFVEVELPSSQLTADAVFTEEATAEAAMAAVYTNMRDAGILRDLYYEMGLYSDELDYYGSAAAPEEQFHKNSLIPSHPTVASWWAASYAQIYSANAILEGVQNSTALDAAFKDRLMGEALLVRGIVHFYLAALYGDVPYILTTSYQENQDVSRTAQEEVFALVLEDLEQASVMLPTEYVQADRTRPNAFVAHAFLARIYLYTAQWEEAEAAANVVITTEELYPWTNDLNQVFLKESQTTLWQWVPRFPGQNSPQASDFIFETAPPPKVALSEELINSFDPMDMRFQQWVQELPSGMENFYYAHKYKAQGNTPASVEYPIILRLAEQYLIRAEALAQQGNLQDAASDLNRIRNRAGLSDVIYTDQDDLLQQIMKERRHELFTEAGHRFFDLKRKGDLDAVLEPLKPGWQPTDSLLPIPDDELLINPNLSPQNPGY